MELRLPFVVVLKAEWRANPTLPTYDEISTPTQTYGVYEGS
jgi:hypothetical protein